MRESRTYGSVRGARDETRVPTATEARVHHVAWRGGGCVAACGACAAPCDIKVRRWRGRSPPADQHREGAARPQGERRAAGRQLQGATRPARSKTAAGRMRRRRKHEEPQMTMEREREHLAQVDQA